MVFSIPAEGLNMRSLILCTVPSFKVPQEDQPEEPALTTATRVYHGSI